MLTSKTYKNLVNNSYLINNVILFASVLQCITNKAFHDCMYNICVHQFRRLAEFI